MSRHDQRPVSLIVVVIDESPILAEALSQEIRDAPVAATSQVVALNWTKLDDLFALKPDIVVLDLDRAVGGPERFILHLRRHCPDTVLLSYGSTLSLKVSRRCIQLGVRAMLPRSAGSLQLRQALTVVVGNGLYIDPVYKDLVMEPAFEAGRDAKPLSDRESVVLRRLSQGMSQKQAAAELGLSQKTVETYKTRGMGKLGLRTRCDLVRHAIAEGWLD